jgi:hypothetical protein
VGLNDVEAFDGSLRKGRPEAEPAASQWDMDLAQGYGQLVKNMGWLHMAENMRRFREEAVERLINGEDGAEEWRNVVKTLDALLKIPNLMIENGRQAKDWLERERQ